MYQKILMCYHATQHSAVALRQATDIARAFNAELHLLGIVVTSGGLAIAQSAGPTDVLGIEHERIRAALDQAASELAGQNVNVLTAIREGNAVTEILGYAHQIKADLVVLGHRERGAVARWFQGSTSSRLLDNLPCSLLIATQS